MSHTGDPRVLDQTWSGGGFIDFAGPHPPDGGADDDESRTVARPSGPLTGDWLILFTQGRSGGNAPVGGGFSLINAVDSGSTDHQTSAWAREVDGTEPVSYTCLGTVNAILALVTLGDQTSLFDGWVSDSSTDEDSAVQTITSNDSVEPFVVLPTSPAASPSTGEVAFSLVCYSSKGENPTNANTAYPFAYYTNVSGTDSNHGFAETTYHGPTFDVTQDWELSLRAQDGLDADQVFPAVTFGTGASSTEIDFDDAPGDVDASATLLRVVPSFIESPPNTPPAFIDVETATAGTIGVGHDAGVPSSSWVVSKPTCAVDDFLIVAFMRGSGGGGSGDLVLDEDGEFIGGGSSAWDGVSSSNESFQAYIRKVDGNEPSTFTFTDGGSWWLGFMASYSGTQGPDTEVGNPIFPSGSWPHLDVNYPGGFSFPGPNAFNSPAHTQTEMRKRPLSVYVVLGDFVGDYEAANPPAGTPSAATSALTRRAEVQNGFRILQGGGPPHGGQYLPRLFSLSLFDSFEDTTEEALVSTTITGDASSGSAVFGIAYRYVFLIETRGEVVVVETQASVSLSPGDRR